MRQPEPDRTQVRFVDKIYIHHKFSFLLGCPKNDIALVKLSASLKFNEFVGLIPLAPIAASNPNEMIGDTCTAIGWGHLEGGE